MQLLPGRAAMAKVTPEQGALHGRHRRPRRDGSESTHKVHLHSVLRGFVGVLCVAMGALFLGFPTVGLFIPGLGQFRNEAQVSGHKLTIRNDLAGHPRHVPALGFTPLILVAWTCVA